MNTLRHQTGLVSFDAPASFGIKVGDFVTVEGSPTLWEVLSLPGQPMPVVDPYADPAPAGAWQAQGWGKVEGQAGLAKANHVATLVGEAFGVAKRITIF